MAVREGVPIESLCSLAELVHPDVAELVIEAYWKADGPEPTVYTIDLGWKLLSIARSIGCLDDVAWSASTICEPPWRPIGEED